jgi:SAM-dependent methyltransferase
MYRALRKIYRMWPKGIRRVVERLPPLRAAKNGLKKLIALATPPQDIYDREFYVHRQAWDLDRSAAAIAESLVRLFSPKSVLDAGCGSGELALHLQEHGVRVLGLEVSDAAIEICRKKGLTVRKFDLGRDLLSSEESFDLAVSLEVAEHLPHRQAGHYVGVLTRAAPIIIISAARPGQGGDGHLNEQPPQYWISLFESMGFQYSNEDTEILRAIWGEKGVKSWPIVRTERRHVNERGAMTSRLSKASLQFGVCGTIFSKNLLKALQIKDPYRSAI